MYVAFINKLASWYFLYNQQAGKAIISGEKVFCGGKFKAISLYVTI